MKHKLSPIFFTLTLVLLAQRGGASISDSKSIQIDFTNAADAASKATWWGADKLTVLGTGLGWDGETASSRDGWIQTTPLAVGLSWRSPYGVSARVEIYPSPAEILLNNGQKFTPYGGEVYVRYSPDLKHWSMWQVLQHTESKSDDEKKAFRKLMWWMEWFSGVGQVNLMARHLPVSTATFPR